MKWPKHFPRWAPWAVIAAIWLHVAIASYGFALLGVEPEHWFWCELLRVC